MYNDCSYYQSKSSKCRHQFSLQRTAVHAAGQCLDDDMLLQARPSTMQQSGAASDQQRPVLAYGRRTPARLPRLYIFNWNQVRIIPWPQAAGNKMQRWAYFKAVLYAIKIVVGFYKVQYEHKIEMWCAVYMCLFQIP